MFASCGQRYSAVKAYIVGHDNRSREVGRVRLLLVVRQNVLAAVRAFSLSRRTPGIVANKRKRKHLSRDKKGGKRLARADNVGFAA